MSVQKNFVHFVNITPPDHTGTLIWTETALHNSTKPNTKMEMQWTPQEDGLREILTLLKESQSPDNATQRAVQQVSFCKQQNAFCKRTFLETRTAAVCETTEFKKMTTCDWLMLQYHLFYSRLLHDINNRFTNINLSALTKYDSCIAISRLLRLN